MALQAGRRDRLAQARARLRDRLTAGTLLAETKEGDVPNVLKFGQVYARPEGVEHNIVNANEHEFAFIEIELKK